MDKSRLMDGRANRRQQKQWTREDDTLIKADERGCDTKHIHTSQIAGAMIQQIFTPNSGTQSTAQSHNKTRSEVR